jgi:alkylation response protein AidB-like acyl-CoA dehydrogenase
MEFRLDAGQVELQGTVARFCADRFPLDTIADREARPVAASDWRALADLGVLGMLVGGSGLGLVEAALVFEQLGSHLAPGPVLWTVLAAPLVDGAAGGDVRVAGVEASAGGGEIVVEHGGDVDVLVVVEGDRVAVHRRWDVVARLEPLDPGTPVARVRVGRTDGGETVDADVPQLRRQGTVLSAALLAGIAGRALGTARDHALDRHQFGVPIGSFQAVKHLLADMYVEANLAQSAVYAAAVEDDDRSAASAKLLATDAALANAATAVQVLGGMGFTWDMLPHRLLKRAWVLEQGFGAADDHALHLGATLGAGARDD